MISLIKNEFIKVFRKKNILILGIVILGFIIFSNIIYKNINNDYSYSYNYYSEENLTWLKNDLEYYDANKQSDISSYIRIKSDIEVIELMKSYGFDSWQAKIITDKAVGIISSMNTAKYELKDDAEYEKIKKEYDNFIYRLNNDDWKSFANEEKLEIETRINELNEQIPLTTDKLQLKELNQELKSSKISLEVVNLRINKNIGYARNYLTNALDQYKSCKEELIYYDGQDNLTYDQKLNIQQLQKSAATAKYSIENEQDISYSTNAREMFLSIVDDYSWLIIIVVIMVGGSIIADEFSKGTIKLLLIKPYKRIEILGAKFITTLLMIPITLIFIMVVQYLVGLIVFGAESLSIPAIIYNFTSNSIETMSLLKYVLIKFVGFLPQVLLLLTLAFALSTLFTSTALASVLPVMGIIGAELINQLAVAYNVNFLRYFVTLNWDLNQFFFGKLPMFEPTSLLFSSVMCIIYFLIMIIPTFIVFKKKNIKNI